VTTSDATSFARRMRGFERTSSLVAARVRTAGESRGFAVSRLLTHWAEVVGEDVAAVCRPVEVSYSRGGFGGTLTVLTTGAQAPMLEMQAERMRERVNACYGYAAVSRVRITQTAPTGFADGQADFSHAPVQPAAPAGPPEKARTQARAAAQGVSDPDLRTALERLGGHVMAAQMKSKEGIEDE
jgi:hypothetical protein